MLQRWAAEVEGNVILLFLGMLFFAVLLVFVEYRFQTDAVVFQAISNILSGFAGALFGILNTKKGPAAEPQKPEIPKP